MAAGIPSARRRPLAEAHGPRGATSRYLSGNIWAITERDSRAGPPIANWRRQLHVLDRALPPGRRPAARRSSPPRPPRRGAESLESSRTPTASVAGGGERSEIPARPHLGRSVPIDSRCRHLESPIRRIFAPRRAGRRTAPGRTPSTLGDSYFVDFVGARAPPRRDSALCCSTRGRNVGERAEISLFAPIVRGGRPRP